MRPSLLALLVVTVMLGAWSRSSDAVRGSGPYGVAVVSAAQEGVVAQAQPSGKLDVDINVNNGGRRWYASPVWIAIGAIALVLLVVLIIMAGRGGGTTIVRE